MPCYLFLLLEGLWKMKKISTKEEWRDVVGYEGIYQVSSRGKVKRLEYYHNMGDKGYKFFPEKILKSDDHTGYERVVLCVNNSRKTVPVHRLVAIAFIPNPDNLPQVNHIDENKKNNNLYNLEWVTSKENINHGTSLARRSYHQRYTQKNRKTVYQYDMNDNLIGIYQSVREAGRQCGFEHSGISHCCNNSKGFGTYKGYRWTYEKEENQSTVCTVG